MIIVAIVAISVFIATLIPEYSKQTPCHSTGVTLIEYGVGVTNCGDTIPVKMPGDLYKEFKEAN
jgi:hypothetical protein